MSASLSKLPLAVGKDEAPLQNSEKFDRFFEEESKEQFRDPEWRVLLTAVESRRHVHEQEHQTTSRARANTQIPAHSQMWLLYSLLSFFFQQGEFLSKCKAGDRCSSFL